METNYKPVAKPVGKPVGNPVGKPVETNLLKLIALQNGLKLNSGKGIVKVKKILLNSLTLN